MQFTLQIASIFCTILTIQIYLFVSKHLRGCRWRNKLPNRQRYDGKSGKIRNSNFISNILEATVQLLTFPLRSIRTTPFSSTVPSLPSRFTAFWKHVFTRQQLPTSSGILLRQTSRIPRRERRVRAQFSDPLRPSVARKRNRFILLTSTVENKPRLRGNLIIANCLRKRQTSKTRGMKGRECSSTIVIKKYLYTYGYRWQMIVATNDTVFSKRTRASLVEFSVERSSEWLWCFGNILSSIRILRVWRVQRITVA